MRIAKSIFTGLAALIGILIILAFPAGMIAMLVIGSRQIAWFIGQGDPAIGCAGHDYGITLGGAIAMVLVGMWI